MYMNVSLIIFLINNPRSDKRQATIWVKRESLYVCFAKSFLKSPG